MGPLLLALFVLAGARTNAVFNMEGTVMGVEKYALVALFLLPLILFARRCCAGKPASWFSLWHTLAPNSTAGKPGLCV